MAFDWQAELGILRTQLEMTARQSQRDHYYHAIVMIDGELPSVPKEWMPGTQACGQRTARNIQVALPEGGYHLHYILDSNIDESDHALLKALQQQVLRTQKVQAAAPNRVLPRFAVPPQPNGLDENFLAWLYLLHWLGHQPGNSVFRTNIEYLNSSDELVSGVRFSPWEQCSTLPEFDPIGLLTRTSTEGEGLSEWKARHQQAGKQLPPVIASSLSKPLLYASINAVARILNSDEITSDGVPADPRQKSGAKRTHRDEYLLELLYRHHKRDDGSVCDVPLEQEKVAEQLSVSQSTVSRMFEDLFANQTPCKGRRAMDCYRHLCEEGLIDPILTRIHLERRESNSIRAILSDKLDRRQAPEPKDE